MLEQQQQYQPPANRFIFFAGVILPAISITLEATTHICADIFFDPIPTIWHLLLVIFVPLAQLQVWFAIRRNAPDRLKLAGFVNSIVIAISIFYSIIYIPLLPLAMVALLFGLGILPLAPYLSLIAALVMRKQLKRIATSAPERTFSIKTRGLLTGLGLTVAVLGLVELPATLTTIGLQMATAGSPQERAEGIRFLRRWGSNDNLLRYCYWRSGLATDLIGTAFHINNPVMPEEARKIYYRVTGKTVDDSIPPRRAGGWLQPGDTVDFDRRQGGTEVGGGNLEGLSLATSNLSGSVDADGGVGYIEWTLVFANDSPEQREVRAEVQLPPGGVVSRLTLWVNGEEREAAFAGRGQVRQAYEQVAIRQRRDPVLITTAGPDRILVQCFPVPPNQGEMKIRFGISLPLILENPTHAKLRLPHFVKTNFLIPDNTHHAIRIESKTSMWPDNPALITGRELDVFTLGGTLHDEALSEPGFSVELYRYDVREMWSNDPFNPDFVVRQSIQERKPTHLRRIVVVIDTSEDMAKWLSQIRAATQSLPPGLDVKTVLAEDADLFDNASLKEFGATVFEEGSFTSRYAEFAGGADNAPALLKAWDLAAEKPGNNAIVWIHKPQLMLLRSVDELKDRWKQRPYGPTLYSVQVSSGSDEIEKRLNGINEVKSVPRTDLLRTDLENLFAQLTGSNPILELVRSGERMNQVDLSGAVKTSDHLTRLWANDEVTRILSSRDPSLEDEATMLAVRYQLVTPVSGAVVLETAEQYRRTGLEPVDPGTVPTIPEPEMVALLIITGAFLIWIAFVKYRGAGRGGCTV